MSKHTPGRWYWDFDRDGNWSLRSDSADVGIMDQRNCPLIEDRILIESAPDLLEALEKLVILAGDRLSILETYAMRDLLATAKGESS